MSRRLNLALVTAALVTAGPAAAWEPAVVGLDDPDAPAERAPHLATDGVATAPLQPSVVGIEEDADAGSAPSVQLDAVASSRWQPEVVGLEDAAAAARPDAAVAASPTPAAEPSPAQAPAAQGERLSRQ